MGTAKPGSFPHARDSRAGPAAGTREAGIPRSLARPPSFADIEYAVAPGGLPGAAEFVWQPGDEPGPRDPARAPGLLARPRSRLRLSAWFVPGLLVARPGS